MKGDYSLRKSRVKGTDYYQVWLKDNMIKHIGSAESIYKKLVRLEELEKKTNELKEKLTNFSEEALQ